MRPEPGLRSPIALQLVCGWRKRAAAIHDLGGEILEECRLRGSESEFPQFEIGGRGGDVERALCGARIVVPVGEGERLLAALGHEGREGNAGGLARLEAHARTQRHDRVEHCTGRSGEVAIRVHRRRIAQRAAASNEACPIRLVTHVTDAIAPGVDDVHAPARRLSALPRAPGGRDRRAPLVPLGLHEQFGERRVREVGGRGRHHHLAITRELEVPGVLPRIRQRHTAHLGRVPGHDRDVGLRFNIFIDPVQGRPIGCEIGPAPLGARTHRLQRGGPDPPGRQVLHVAELTAVILRAVIAPSRDRQVLVAAVTAPVVVQHHGVRHRA